MANFCTQCGAKLSPGQRFCTQCGAKAEDTGTQQAVSAETVPEEQPVMNTAEPVPEEQPVINAAEPIPEEKPQVQEIISEEKPKKIASEKPVKNKVQKAAGAVFNSVASGAVGETNIGGFGAGAAALSGAFGASSAVSAAFEVLSPFKAVYNGAKSFILGLKNIKQNKRALVFSVIMAVIWIVLGRTQHTGIAGLLSTLTCSRGNIISRVFTAAGLSTVLYGGIPRAVKGAKGIFKNGGFDIGFLVVGIGVSAFIYSIIAGKLFTAGIMCGISGAFMTLQALGSKGGFISSLTASVTAKGGVLDNAKYKSLLTGAVIGFLVSVLLAETYRRIRLVPSLLIIALGVVLCFVLPKKGVAENA